MKSHRYEASAERRALTAMITDRAVLAALTPGWGKEPLPSKWANIVGGWCVEFYRRHHEAPGRAVTGLFGQWAERRESQGDPETVALVEKFLSGLSDRYASDNGEASLSAAAADEASALLEKTRLKKLADLIQAKLEAGDVAGAEEARAQSRRIEIGAGSYTDVHFDQEAIRSALERAHAEPVMQYPGALGGFLRNQFGRGCFVAFEGADKRGKSQMLLDLAWRAKEQRSRVAFFETGDMTRDQVMARMIARSLRRPLRDGIYRYPMSLSVDKDGKATVAWEDRKAEGDVDWRQAAESLKDNHDRKVREDDDFFRLVVEPGGTLSVAMIRSTVERWSDDGWSADACIIDYADLLKPPTGHTEERDRINAVWLELRALSQSVYSKGILVVTATQANAEAYRAKTLDMRNFSGDKRKNAHVTLKLGINVSDEDRTAGTMRLNVLVGREGHHDPRKCCTIAPCLAIADPVVRSAMPAEK